MIKNKIKNKLMIDWREPAMNIYRSIVEQNGGKDEFLIAVQ